MWSLLCIPPLASLVVSDLRSRTVGTMNLLVFGIMILGASLLESGWREVALNVGLNSVVCVLLWLSLWGYSRLRGMRLYDMMGSGDLLFVLATVPFFGTREFVFYMILSCVFTLALWWSAGPKYRGDSGIPLVSGLGTCLGVVILCRLLSVLI